MRRFVSGPTIAALILQRRMTVNDHLRAGRYGRTYRIGRVVYVDLAELVRAEGREFSEEQIERATAGLPDRILTVTEKEVA
ncbi:MAG: hypothetical protein WA750_01050 [Pseudolabrys sp.]